MYIRCNLVYVSNSRANPVRIYCVARYSHLESAECALRVLSQHEERDMQWLHIHSILYSHCVLPHLLAMRHSFVLFGGFLD